MFASIIPLPVLYYISTMRKLCLESNASNGCFVSRKKDVEVG